MNQGGDVQIDPLASQHLHLAVQRQVPGEFHHADMRQQCCGRHAAIERTWRRLGLHDRPLARPAAIARPVNAFDAQHGWHHVQHFADLFADEVQLALAARAGFGVRFDHDIHARQMCRQTANIARRFRSLWLPVGIGRRWQFHWFTRQRRNIAQGQWQLRFRLALLFRSRAVESPFQRFHHRAQAFVLFAQGRVECSQTLLFARDFLGFGHARKVPGVHPFRQNNLVFYCTFSIVAPGLTGAALRAGICVQSMPANNRRSCVELSVSAPLVTAGQVKRPASSRFVTRQRPDPSQSSNFIRSVRLARNTKTSPA